MPGVFTKVFVCATSKPIFAHIIVIPIRPESFDTSVDFVAVSTAVWYVTIKLLEVFWTSYFVFFCTFPIDVHVEIVSEPTCKKGISVHFCPQGVHRSFLSIIVACRLHCSAFRMCWKAEGKDTTLEVLIAGARMS